MELESAIKYFGPKGMSISDEPRATASDSLTGTDLMGAIGMCQSKAHFGMAAFLAKTGISNDDRTRAIAELLSYAHQTAPKLVIRAAGGKLGKCLMVLSKLAFEEYSRSAATTSDCPQCSGRGYHVNKRQVVVYLGYTSPFDGEEKVPPRHDLQEIRENCSACAGKGKISARCRCNGTGRVRDLAESARQGVPVDRECERCSGRGYKRMPASRAFRAISVLLPELQERTWNRNWKPFFEKLVAECEIEESHADAEFRKITQ